MCNKEYAIRKTNPYDLLAVSNLKNKFQVRINSYFFNPPPQEKPQKRIGNGVTIIKYQIKE